MFSRPSPCLITMIYFLRDDDSDNAKLFHGSYHWHRKVLWVSLKTRKQVTCWLLTNQRRTFLSAIKCNNADHIFCARVEVGEGDGIPRRGHSVFSRSPTSMFRVMANPVASDGGSRSNPMDRERVGSDIRKVNASWGIQTCFSHPGEEERERQRKDTTRLGSEKKYKGK